MESIILCIILCFIAVCDWTCVLIEIVRAALRPKAIVQAKYNYDTFDTAYESIKRMMDKELAFKVEFELKPKTAQMSTNLTVNTEELSGIANRAVETVYKRINPDLISYIENKFLIKDGLLEYMCEDAYNSLVLLARDFNKEKITREFAARNAAKIIDLNKGKKTSK